jgi:hypothetical protein
MSGDRVRLQLKVNVSIGIDLFSLPDRMTSFHFDLGFMNLNPSLRLDAVALHPRSFYSHSQGLLFGTLLTAVEATAALYRD